MHVLVCLDCGGAVCGNGTPWGGGHAPYVLDIHSHSHVPSAAYDEIGLRKWHREFFQFGESKAMKLNVIELYHEQRGE